MYSQIICNKNCIYQHSGNCCKTTTTSPTNSNNKCEFYIENTDYKFPSKRMFWKEILQIYYN